MLDLLVTSSTTLASFNLRAKRFGGITYGTSIPEALESAYREILAISGGLCA